MDVFNNVLGRRTLNVKLPTGYGKTFTACGVYSILKHHGEASRVLFIFPSDAQLEQFKQDGPADLRDAGVEGPLAVIDLRFFGAEAIRKHRENANQVYAITIQSLIRTGIDIVHMLMQTGRWMVVVDEYHHYGFEARWGQTVNALNCQYRLAMSATPGRPNDDSAFGEPDIQVTYRKAISEGAVKPLLGHSYIYRIETIGPDGSHRIVTTDQLIQEAGGDTPDKIERMMINRQMRWSPDYIGPLISHPLERLIVERIRTGLPLQAIIGAMCVSHAEMVCGLVRVAFPDLTVDWVGHGAEFGRPPEKNREVLARFCPPKDPDGRRSPTLDVLVHVAMAGEGLDSIYVTEVIHLNSAGVNNGNHQENGRAARAIPGIAFNPTIFAHINFDSSAGYATDGYVGRRIELAMDERPATDDPDEPENPKGDGESDWYDRPQLPASPMIHVWRMELDSINSGDPEVQRMATVLNHLNPGRIDLAAMRADLSHPDWDLLIDTYRLMRAKEASQHDEESIINQWKEKVKGALGRVTNVVVWRLYGADAPRDVYGAINKVINTRKCSILGPVSKNAEVYQSHYQWLRQLEEEICRTRRLPAWIHEGRDAA